MEKNKSYKHEVNIKIEGEEWKKALHKAYEKNNKKAKIDGFRPGKAPYEIFVKHYGIENLFIDAADSCLQESYLKAITDSKLIPVTEPKVDIKEIDENHVEFIFTIITKPEIKIKKYEGLKIKKDKLEVKEEEIQDEIDHLLEQYAELVVKEGTVENGDTVIIDYEGFLDGVPFEGGKAENYSLVIGSNTFIPGFEEQLIGMDKDSEKEIKVTFPEDYHAEDLKGAKVTFKVKVHEVKETQIPELDADFFEDLAMDGVDSKEKLEEEVKASIKARKDTENENKYIDALLEAAAKNVEVEIPDEMVHEEVHRMLHQYEDNLKMQGITLEQFYKYTNSNQEALEDQMKEEAKKRVLFRLMLEAIAKKENIVVTDEEADKEASELATKYNMTKEELLKNFGGIDMIKYDIEMRKTIDVLKK